MTTLFLPRAIRTWWALSDGTECHSVTMQATPIPWRSRYGVLSVGHVRSVAI